MKTILITLVVGSLISFSSCEKDNTRPSSPEGKDKLNECKNRGGSWDITDPEGD